MSLHYVSAAFNADLPVTEKFCLVALGDFASPEGHVWPSVAEMARKTGMSQRTVRRAINALVEKGYIAPSNERPTRAARQGTNCYRLVFVELEFARAPAQSKARSCPKALKQQVIAVFDHRCEYCCVAGDEHFGPDGRLWTVDRIIPGHRGGEYVADNITLACHSCNSAKGARDIQHAVRTLADLVGGSECPPQQKDGGDTVSQKGGQAVHKQGSECPPIRKGTVKEPLEAYPSTLNQDAWRDWIEYRRERKLPPYKATGALRQCRWLAQWPHDEQQAIVDESIRNNYQGLFELKGNGTGTPSSKAGRFEQSTDALRRWADG